MDKLQRAEHNLALAIYFREKAIEERDEEKINHFIGLAKYYYGIYVMAIEMVEDKQFI